MLDSERLEELIDTITERIILANRMDELDNLLNSWGLHNLIENEPLTSDIFYDTYRKGKIVVLGSSQVKELDLLGIVKSLGLDKDRFEFCLDYKQIVSYQFSKLQYNTEELCINNQYKSSCK